MQRRRPPLIILLDLMRQLMVLLQLFLTAAIILAPAKMEKFIPTIIRACLKQEPIPVYGSGLHVRDWLFVDDHIEALWLILDKGKKGEVYDIGGGTEKKNIELVQEVIRCFHDSEKKVLSALITQVSDCPGHDFRYAIDSAKTRRELGWMPRYAFSDALRQTVAWYKKKYENRLCHSCSTEVQ